MTQRRVVVTGLGMLTCLGGDVASTWENILAGKSGISAVDHFDASQYSTRFAGFVRDFNVEAYMPAKDARRFDEFIQYGMAAGIQAFQDSGLEVTADNAQRIGVAGGSGIGGLTLIERNHDILNNDGLVKFLPSLCQAPSSI